MRTTLFFFLTFAILSSVSASNLTFKVNENVGAIESIRVDGDTRDMNWVLAENQEKWITKTDLWGLGRISTRNVFGYNKSFTWQTPIKQKSGKDYQESVYQAGDITISVSRKAIDGNILEEYTFTNNSYAPINITDLSINTPFNDNYTETPESTLNERCHAHIWAEGGNSAYVCALNIGANAPHVGLVMQKGATIGHEVFKRSLETGSSNFRGVIAMRIEPFKISAKKSKKISWVIFAHEGWDDFFKKAKSHGAVIAKFETPTTAILGENIKVEFDSDKKITNPRVRINSKVVEHSTSLWSNKITVNYKPTEIGEHEIVLEYGDSKKTKAVANVVKQPMQIMQERAKFLIEKHQLKKPDDLRNNAFMIYDNIENKIYLNDDARKSPDTNEGAERIGMGTFLARYAQITGDDYIKNAVLKYANFVQENLQNGEYRTTSSVKFDTRDRYYNYLWVAYFYNEIYKLTGDKFWANKMYQTWMAYYRKFGHAKYSQLAPIKSAIESLRKAKMDFEANELLRNFTIMAYEYADMSNYNLCEVSIASDGIAGMAIFLMQMSQLYDNTNWLNLAENHIKRLANFNGKQPHYRINSLPIRHWEAYWFGKCRPWGDNFPHWWGGISAMALKQYDELTGKNQYSNDIVNILRAGLSNYFEDGRASCAYVYPDRIDGKAGKHYDDFSNEQDWILMFYLMNSTGY